MCSASWVWAVGVGVGWDGGKPPAVLGGGALQHPELMFSF